jgi:hypothetical protein
MKIEIIEQNNDYITIKIPTESEKKKFIEIEEEIAQKVNEVGKLLTKDSLEKLNEKNKIIKRNDEELILKDEKKEDEIVYSLPKLGGEVATVSIGVDGTCSYVGNDGWRESMVGTISLYDENGDRLHSIYVAHAPEYGKEGFKHNMTEEIEEIKKLFHYQRDLWVLQKQLRKIGHL